MLQTCLLAPDHVIEKWEAWLYHRWLLRYPPEVRIWCFSRRISMLKCKQNFVVITKWFFGTDAICNIWNTGLEVNYYKNKNIDSQPTVYNNIWSSCRKWEEEKRRSATPSLAKAIYRCVRLEFNVYLIVLLIVVSWLIESTNVDVPFIGPLSLIMMKSASIPPSDSLISLICPILCCPHCCYQQHWDNKESCPWKIHCLSHQVGLA